jgi:3-methyl-2-oxobutanoate hydroxymethyltransferase
LEVPTIGIGAGPHTSGQVLVFHDMLGMMSHPHHEHFVPKFCKKYARVGDAITKGLADFCKDVQEGIFPGKDFSPYVVSFLYYSFTTALFKLCYLLVEKSCRL